MRRHGDFAPSGPLRFLFTGLFISLWTWKCVMLVVFQNKIIYMPGLPPNARRETIANYAHMCGGIQWTEERTKAADGTSLGMAVTTVRAPGACGSSPITDWKPRARVFVLYFQGNASSIPPRLPDLSWVLRAISDGRDRVPVPLELTFVCLSYRGYWTSKGRPSEKGIRLDAEAGLRWIADQHQKRARGSGEKPIILIWGQSIGCGVTTNLAATGRLPEDVTIDGLLLETPFLSLRAMLSVLYPQRWLPYQYLWPFLRNQLDSWSNLGLIAGSSEERGGVLPNIFILEADRDELVPKAHGEALFQRCQDVGIPVEKGAAPVAYHSEAIARGEGKKIAAQALMSLIKRALEQQGRG
ncbi:Alpha/Beta hydrolase protein [Immersiella caudata]|uniref:Alpha/Beta hydrolase protein n=1 Tax=Immersiella caudata TaxID=314043 RepID=A0AA40CBD7_9PEZI|nr:Alpha/Beta hydrolase protein [Immersiella caudata]